MSVLKRTIPFLVLGLLISLSALAGKPSEEPPIDVVAVDPDYGLQGETRVVKIVGNEFGEGNTVYFLVAGSRDSSQIIAGPTTFTDNDPAYPGFDTLTTEIQILSTATESDYDVEVRAGKGRKGKGTTLFKVQSSTRGNGCGLMDFEAVFDDAPEDGVYSDFYPAGASYVAGGGNGFRLDTNGSQKLERRNDTRFVQIDFNANGVCDTDDAQNPGGAVGFCSKLKGVDMRIEHQVQERLGLCSLDAAGVNGPVSMLQAVGVTFEGDPGAKLPEPDNKDGVAGGYRLSYGCMGFRIDPQVWEDHADQRALITRIDEYTWRMEGEWACLHTILGNLLTDDSGDPVILYMPFALTITDVDAPWLQ